MERNSLIGNKYGRLKVIKLYNKIQRKTKEGKKRGYQYFYLCKCECGNECVVQKENLQSGATKSCGCLQKEIATDNLMKVAMKHGYARHKGKEKLYNIWHAMKDRCYNKNNKMYVYYGGRNIKVCDDWKNNYILFRKWAIENDYAEGLDLDRINNNGNYEPQNCRFVSHRENLMNRRNTIKVKIKDKTYTLQELSEIYNIKIKTLQTRYNRGKRDEKLIEPVRKNNN